MNYLLDTNACLDFLLGRSEVLAKRVEHVFGHLAVSSISAAELRVGNRRSEDPIEDARRVDRFLAGVQVAAFDLSAADAYARIVRAKGVRRSSFDHLIAAHAVSLDLPLVTNNLRHFSDIPALRVQNWTVRE